MCVCIHTHFSRQTEAHSRSKKAWNLIKFRGLLSCRGVSGRRIWRLRSGNPPRCAHKHLLQENRALSCRRLRRRPRPRSQIREKCYCRFASSPGKIYALAISHVFKMHGALQIRYVRNIPAVRLYSSSPSCVNLNSDDAKTVSRILSENKSFASHGRFSETTDALLRGLSQFREDAGFRDFNALQICPKVSSSRELSMRPLMKFPSERISDATLRFRRLSSAASSSEAPV